MKPMRDAALERTEIALAFISEREREGKPLPSYGQIANHMSRVTGQKITRNVVAGLLDRHVKREWKEPS